MEILPADAADIAEYQINTPRKYQPTAVLGWLRDNDEVLPLLWSIPSRVWLTSRHGGVAELLPTADQKIVSQMMQPNVKALGRATAQ